MNSFKNFINHLTLRKRIILIYSTIVGLSLALYGGVLYLSVSHELESNLMTSLTRVANVIDQSVSDNVSKNLLNLSDSVTIARFNAKIYIPSSDTSQNIKLPAQDNIQSHIRKLFTENPLFNSKTYLIQIADTNNRIIWRSRNIRNVDIPLLPTSKELAGITQDSLNSTPDNYEYVPKLILKPKLQGSFGDSIFIKMKFENKQVQIYSKRCKYIVITVGYFLTDIYDIQSKINYILIIALPIILLISTFVGWYLSKISLKPIDLIINETNQISISNLSKRLPYSGLDDEVGRLTNTINLMIDRLEKSVFQIKQFTSDASHELRTPLTILRGELELALVKQKSPVEYSRVVASALDEVIRLSNVVEALLELSRADLGSVKMNFVRRSLSKLMIDICEDAEILADQKRLVVSYYIEPHIEAEFDPPRIHQAVLNIIDNAIKYNHENGKLFIELKSLPNHAEITVRDNGVGIPKEDLPKIFDRFYRIDKSRSSNIFGTGLGLSIVQWIVKSHHGESFVHSDLGQGTEFIIRLPYKQEYF